MHHLTDTAWLKTECDRAQDFGELVAVAMRELDKFPAGAEIVCGPVTTGGRGTIEENLRVFGAVIAGLRADGRPIFSQVPYEDRIFAFKTKWQQSDPKNAGAYYTAILTDFYLPLLRSGKITRGWFIPGYRSSTGAAWEHDRMAEFGISCAHLDDAWIDFALAEHAH